MEIVGLPGEKVGYTYAILDEHYFAGR